MIQAAIAEALRRATKRPRNGIVLTECGFRLAPDVVQAPDVAFIREERRAGIDLDRYVEFGPDLAVEVVSPDDNAARLQRKSRITLRQARLLSGSWNPGAVTVTIYESSGVFRTPGLSTK
jgi:Uma2 family endonuclease